MSGPLQILPACGEGDRREAMVEGRLHTRCASWRRPSTSLRLVPLPVPGRNA